jgi:hypothetical protein
VLEELEDVADASKITRKRDLTVVDQFAVWKHVDVVIVL